MSKYFTQSSQRVKGRKERHVERQRNISYLTRIPSGDPSHRLRMTLPKCVALARISNITIL